MTTSIPASNRDAAPPIQKHRLKFENRLRTILMVSIIAGLVPFALAIHTLNNAVKFRNNTIEVHLKNMELSKDIEVLMERLFARNRSFAYTGLPEFIEGLEASQKELEARIVRLQENMKSTKEAPLLDALSGALQSNIRAEQDLVRFRTSDTPTKDAVDFYVQRVGPTRIDLRNALRAVTMHEQERLAASIERASQAERWGLAFVLTGGAVTGLISLILLSLLRRTLQDHRDAIAAQKHAEAALSTSEETLEQGVRVANIGIFDHDQRTDLIYASPQMRRICGWGPEEPMTVSGFIERVHPEDRQRIAQTIAKAHDPKGNGAYDVEHRMVHRDGSVHWIRAKSQTHFSGKGDSRKAVRTIGAIIEITESKNRESALRASQTFLQKMVDVSPILTVVFDLTQGRTVFLSPQSKVILGYEPEEVNAYTDVIERLVHPDDVQRIVTYLSDISKIADQESLDLTFQLRHKDGSLRYVLARAAVFLRDAHGNATQIIAKVSDITAQKNVERALRNAVADLNSQTKRLERSNRELEQFAGVAAHDLRAPLRSMRGWIDILDVSIPKPRTEEIENAIGFIYNTVTKANALIEDVLEIARVNVSTVNYPVDLKKTVDNVVNMLSTDIQTAGVHLQVETLPVVAGNPSHFESLFSNLIRNAITYRDKTRPPQISIGCSETDEYYQVFVKDNGIGIEPQYQEQIFEMFRRLHRDDEYPGTGIGLAFCRKLVELSGGRIWVDSAPGQGSTFFFTYPRNGSGGNGYATASYDS